MHVAAGQAGQLQRGDSLGSMCTASIGDPREWTGWGSGLWW